MGRPCGYTCKSIVPDDLLMKVHGNADFGNLSPREVVDQTLLTYAFGYSSGHTAMRILQDHGLLRKGKGYNALLTKKGFRYLKAMFKCVPLSKIANLRIKGAPND